jgi:hypothetical protein
VNPRPFHISAANDQLPVAIVGPALSVWPLLRLARGQRFVIQSPVVGRRCVPGDMSRCFRRGATTSIEVREPCLKVPFSRPPGRVADGR